MAICYDRYGRSYYCQSSGWYSWGRWVLLGALIIAFILIFFLFSCITARRRRKIGRKPMYGTGWAAAGNHGQATYNPGYNQQQAPAQYGNNVGTNNYAAPAPQGGYGGQNQSYFGGQQTGVEMPHNTYAPPAGPPPNKY